MPSAGRKLQAEGAGEGAGCASVTRRGARPAAGVQAPGRGGGAHGRSGRVATPRGSPWIAIGGPVYRAGLVQRAGHLHANADPRGHELRRQVPSPPWHSLAPAASPSPSMAAWPASPRPALFRIMLRFRSRKTDRPHDGAGGLAPITKPTAPTPRCGSIRLSSPTSRSVLNVLPSGSATRQSLCCMPSTYLTCTSPQLGTPSNHSTANHPTWRGATRTASSWRWPWWR